MELFKVFSKYLNDVEFALLIPELFSTIAIDYHLSFYNVSADASPDVKNEIDHIDKKINRLSDLLGSVMFDIKEMNKVISKYSSSDTTVSKLSFAKDVHGRLRGAHKKYENALGQQQQDWYLLGRTRVMQENIIASYEVKSPSSVRKVAKCGNPKRPMLSGIVHFAVNVNPINCDFFYFSSCNSIPGIGSGDSHKVNFIKGKLVEIETSETYRC